MYKMIAIDLDDTLLTDDLQIPSGCISAIKKAVDKGVIVTLATGRMYASAAPIAAQLELNVPIITYQGALIKGALDGQTLYERVVSAEISRIVHEMAREHNVHLQIYQNDILYSPENNEKVKKYVEIAKVGYVVEENFEKLCDQPSTKLLYFDEPQKLDVLKQLLTGKLGDQVYITKSKPYFLEILHPEASKGQALLYLAGRFGIQPSEVIAIGDSYNDLDMMEAAGLAVAMGNSIKEVKKRADYVTSTNNEEGVRQTIEKFILS